MRNNEEIGGYFELEINKSNSLFHNDAIKVNSGRNALEYILITKRIKKIFIPYYSCMAIIQPLKKHKIDYHYYHIDNNLEIEETLPISSHESLLYINYFGIKDIYIKSLAKKFPNLIVDNCQSFFSSNLEGIDSFYSPRKFFGVTDGGFLFTENKSMITTLSRDESYDRFNHLLRRIDLGAIEGYQEYKNNEELMKTVSLKQMSKLTEAILSSINYGIVKEKRKINFDFLNSHLINTNMLQGILTNLQMASRPMIYPYLIEDGELIKRRFIENKIFIATYWPELSDSSFLNSLESNLVKKLIAIPIDHRYSIPDMEQTLDLLS